MWGRWGRCRRCRRRRSARLKGKTRSWAHLEEDRSRARHGLVAPPPTDRMWSREDKRALLQGLRRWGTRGGQAAASVPGKPAALVTKKIKREKRRQRFITETRWLAEDGQVTVLDSGEKTYTRGPPDLGSLDLPDAAPRGEIQEVERRRARVTPVDRWLEVVEGSRGGLSCTEALPSVLHSIAEFEAHPSPEQCGGVDYKAIYSYLATLCQGEAPPELDAATSARVARLLPSMVSVVRGRPLEKETHFLENYRGGHTMYRYEDSFDFTSKSAREVEELSSIAGMNVLGLHPEMLADRRLPKLATITLPLVEGDTKEEEELEMDDDEDDDEEDEQEEQEEDDGGDEKSEEMMAGMEDDE